MLCQLHHAHGLLLVVPVAGVLAVEVGTAAMVVLLLLHKAASVVLLGQRLLGAARPLVTAAAALVTKCCIDGSLQVGRGAGNAILGPASSR